MRRATAAAALILLAGAATAGAMDLSVGYLEGEVEVQRGAEWLPVSIGDALASDAVVRLASGAYLELDGKASKITLTQPGSYSLARLRKEAEAADTGNAGEVISDHLAALIGTPAPRSSPAFGIRAERPDIPEDFFGAGTDSGTSTGSVGPSSTSGNGTRGTSTPEPPRTEPRAAVGTSPEGKQPDAHLTVALAYAEAGDVRGALRELAQARPSAGDPWLADFMLLKAKLLVQSFAFADAAALLESSAKLFSADSKRAPLYFLLLGMSYRGAGDSSKAATSLMKAAALAPGSDIEAAAKAALQDR